MATTQPIRSKKHVRELLAYYFKLGQFRNHVLILLCIHTALRISDLLSLRWDDVYDFEKKCVKRSITIVEKKTGKVKTIALHQAVISALTLYAGAALPGRFLIENSRTKLAISRVQAYRLIRAAGEAVKIGFHVSCHSLRKTFGYHLFNSGISALLIMDIFNHSSLVVTKRYLGITQDDKNEVYLGLSFA